MTRDQFVSKIPYKIIHPSHGELERKIVEDKYGEIIVNYVKYTSPSNSEDNSIISSSYGTIGKSFQEVYDSLYPFLVEQGHIIDNEKII
jgi:hypothetical protein